MTVVQCRDIDVFNASSYLRNCLVSEYTFLQKRNSVIVIVGSNTATQVQCCQRINSLKRKPKTSESFHGNHLRSRNSKVLLTHAVPRYGRKSDASLRDRVRNSATLMLPSRS